MHLGAGLKICLDKMVFEGWPAAIVAAAIVAIGIIIITVLLCCDRNKRD